MSTKFFLPLLASKNGGERRMPLAAAQNMNAAPTLSRQTSEPYRAPHVLDFHLCAARPPVHRADEKLGELRANDRVEKWNVENTR